MKYLVILIALISSNIFALNFEIVDSCSETPVFSSVVTDSYDNVGELSLDVLEANSIQNLSSQFGISQLMNSPIGIDAMEVLSDTVMRSHGWCYSVDGEVPELLMNEFELTGEEKVITWFMGYSTYVGNMQTGEATWEGQCIPSNSLPQLPFPEFCE